MSAQALLAQLLVAPVGYKVLDRDYRVTFVNHEAARILGTTREALEGRALWEAFPQAVGGPFWTAYHRVMDERVPVEEEAYFGPLGAWFRIQGFPTDDGIAVFCQDVTERRSQHERLELVLQAANAAFWDLDVPSGRFTISPRMREMYGLAPSQDVSAASLLAMVHDDDRDRIATAPTPPPNGVGHYGGRFRVRRTDGAERHFRMNGAVYGDHDGRIIRSIGIIVDITDEVESRASLGSLERQLQEAQRLASIGSWSWDLGTGEVIWSPETYRLLQIDPATPPSFELVLGMAVDEQRRQDFMQRVQDALAGTRPYDFETVARRPDGSLIRLHARARIERSPDGVPLRMTGTMQDITASHDREEALRESEVRFRTLVESSPNGIFLTGPEGQVTYANQQLLDLFEADIAGFASGGWMERLHPDDRPRVEGRALAATAARVRFSEEYRIRTSGGERWLRVTTSPYFTHDGQYGGQVGSVVDITAERHAAEEHALLEAQVQQAQKLESLGILAGGIAHDFNNMLVGVLTNATLLLDTLPPASPVREPAAEIERAAKRAADLTRQLLAYSGRARFVVGPVDLSDLTRDMAQLLRTALAAGARLHFTLAEGLPPVRADVTQLRQVVMNLITNASDALDGGSGTISLETRLVDALDLPPDAVVHGAPTTAGPFVSLVVADSGSGMDAETLSRIFEPFFTTKFTGRGLGLAATLGIVRGHDGVIAVSSVPGRGTTFRLFFPALPHGTPLEGTTGVGGEPVAPAESPAPASVLIVDDDVAVLAVIERALARLGYDVQSATGGRDALRAIGSATAAGRRPQLVLLDLTMPEMSGRDVLSQLAELAPGLPVVLMSGYNEQQVEQDMAGLGLAGFLQKPFTSDELARAVRAALARGTP